MFQSRSGFSPCLDPQVVEQDFDDGLFQSRSGFSPCLDRRTRPRGSLTRRFNPGLGFLPASTSAKPPAGGPGSPTPRRPCFNPGLGFLPASTDELSQSDHRRRVSIPVWVFSLPRPAGGRHHRRDPDQGFNPGLGFLPASTPIRARPTPAGSTFQSRSGFSPCLDMSNPTAAATTPTRFNPGLGFLPASTHSARRSTPSSSCFNPGLGFLPASTQHPRRTDSDARTVSIPVWVFSLPRRPPNGRTTASDHRFNPGLGFLPASTTFRTVQYKGIDLFQSRSGFSPCLDSRTSSPQCRQYWFQSRSGFSPCLDRGARRVRSGVGTVSIPVWVFSLPRRQQSRTRSASLSCFNPGLGFLPASTPARSGRSTAARVSIPVWVFSLPRPQTAAWPGATMAEFQSRSGFSPCLDNVMA